MTIKYANGAKVEAVLLSRTESNLRVVVRGSEDTLELDNRGGTWVSEDCEPVEVEFAWQRKTPREIVSEADCLCSHKLAARLIHLLWNPDRDDVLPGETPTERSEDGPETPATLREAAAHYQGHSVLNFTA